MQAQPFDQKYLSLIDDYIERSLARFRLSVSQRFATLVEAMKYSLEGGGKRLRPMLLLNSAATVGLSTEKVLPAACAIEYIHSYSLIHDDLPALDDDDTRRGRPSSHKKFGEAVAILTGDALLTEAFGQLHTLSEHFEPARVLAAVELVVMHAGVRGMVGGQLLDVTADTKNYSLPEVEFIHIHKTGALILASVMIPARLAGIDEKRLARLRRYGEAVGLAFQISDDLLDSEAVIRYSRGPRKKPKPTYAELMSPSEMRDKLNGLIDTAVQAISEEGDRASGLIGLAEFIRTRKS